MSLLDDARLVLDVLRAHPTLDPTRQSRFTKMAESVCAGGDSIIPSSRADFGLVRQANRDLLLFAFIWHTMKPAPGDTELWRRFGRLFGDDPLPSRSNTTSAARNTQAELFFEAVLRRAGLEPVHQPHAVDFRCRLGAREFVVEAKLARTVPAVRRELKKAAGQIRDSGLPGIILIDHTFALNPRESEQSYAFEAPLEGFNEIQRRRFQTYRANELARVEAELAQKGVLGAMFVEKLVVQNGLDRSSSAGLWQLFTITDPLLLPCKTHADQTLVRTVFDLVANLGMPAPPATD